MLRFELKLDLSSVEKLTLLLSHYSITPPLHGEPTRLHPFSGVCQKAFQEMSGNHYLKQNSEAEGSGFCPGLDHWIIYDMPLTSQMVYIYI